MAQFQHGIFDCFNDCGTCIVTYIFPCYTAGKNAEAVEENCLLFALAELIGFGCYTNAVTRLKIRERYGIEVRSF